MPATRRPRWKKQFYDEPYHRKKEWRFKYDGNYCGPGWSNAQYQDSVAAGTVPPVTPLDALCKAHDEAYGQNRNRATADLQFGTSAIAGLLTPQSLPQAIRQGAAGIAVGLQGVARTLNFIGDERVLTVDAGPPRMQIDGPVFNVGQADPHFFPILKMAKYAKRKRRTTAVRRKRRSSKPYAKRRTAYKRKYNKKRTSYRPRRSRGRRNKSTYNHASLRLEYGSSVADPQHVTVGQGLSPINVLQTACYSIVRQLFKNHGQEFVNFEELAQATTTADDRIFQVRSIWQNSINANQTVFAYISVPSTTTFETIALALKDQIIAKAKVEGDAIFLQRVELLQTDNDQEEIFFVLASVDIRRMKVHWNYHSSLRMQNRTAAGANGANIDVNNVNPLEGRVYYQKTGQNYFEPSYKPPGEETFYKGWVPFHSVGQWDDRAAARAGTKAWTEPPTKGMVGATMVKKFALHPGQVITDSITSKGVIYFNTMLMKLFNAFHKAGTSVSSDYQLPCLMGNCRAYNFEKLVFDRSETAQVTIGYEVNQSYGCTVTFKKLRSEPVTRVYPLT